MNTTMSLFYSYIGLYQTRNDAKSNTDPYVGLGFVDSQNSRGHVSNKELNKE